MPFTPAFDDEGFLVCPEHSQRRYGWLSARSKPHKAFPFDPANPQYVWRPDYSETRLAQDQAYVALMWPDLNYEPMPETSTRPEEVLSPEELEELEESREVLPITRRDFS